MKAKITKSKEVAISFTDEQVKEQVSLVLSLGRRTIEDSFKLGEMLTYKKSEKAHGEWLPYLDEIGLNRITAFNLMKAFTNKDEYITGMSYSKLLGHSNVSNVNISKDKSPDWFDQHTTDNIDAFTLRTIIKTMAKIEKRYGVVYLNEFAQIVYKILEQGITHINYKETWKQE
jgi:hypothetical protein